MSTHIKVVRVKRPKIKTLSLDYKLFCRQMWVRRQKGKKKDNAKDR